MAGARLPKPAEGATWFSVTRCLGTEAPASPAQPGDCSFFLALGNDGRDRRRSGPRRRHPRDRRQPATRAATIIDIPRDTEAPRRRQDQRGTARAAASRGSPRQLNRMMGMHHQYAMTTNFPGFDRAWSTRSAASTSTSREPMARPGLRHGLPTRAAAPERRPGRSRSRGTARASRRRHRPHREPGLPDHRRARRTSSSAERRTGRDPEPARQPGPARADRRTSSSSTCTGSGASR